MPRSRLRSKRAVYKQRPATHLGWSKGKTVGIMILLSLVAAFILLIIIGLFLLR